MLETANRLDVLRKPLVYHSVYIYISVQLSIVFVIANLGHFYDSIKIYFLIKIYYYYYYYY